MPLQLLISPPPEHLSLSLIRILCQSSQFLGLWTGRRTTRMRSQTASMSANSLSITLLRWPRKLDLHLLVRILLLRSNTQPPLSSQQSVFQLSASVPHFHNIGLPQSP